MENQWSKELIEYTRNHFGDLGTTRLKNLKPGYSEEIKGKQIHFESFDSEEMMGN